MSPSGEGRLAADVQGNLAAAAFDEQAVDARLLAPPALWTGAAVVAVFALKALLGLLTRLDRALWHPRQRAILRYIQSNPGVRVREAMRGTGIPSGPFRHHLKALIARGEVVRHVQGGFVYLYENRGRHDLTWDKTALLRDGASNRIHAWLRHRHGATHAEILDAMAAHGWSRSKLEKRIARLQRAGLVAAWREGRINRYRAIAPAKPQGGLEPLSHNSG